ncbi:hypothetical protein SAR116_0468 [Candidatus Puniceispirillum marinum IMCC1322]|uniref:Uncharacterized protein n=1 Tax=Puniceispirillum marinum (strain IMCC1322) TaxID=488538 RepID=D5BQZ5_PUNMI|nr:hypothetical protein SAR116_0468 [Candidatus Puniceispirillum marinum IMCC1322]
MTTIWKQSFRSLIIPTLCITKATCTEKFQNRKGADEVNHRIKNGYIDKFRPSHHKAMQGDRQNDNSTNGINSQNTIKSCWPQTRSDQSQYDRDRTCGQGCYHHHDLASSASVMSSRAETRRSISPLRTSSPKSECSACTINVDDLLSLISMVTVPGVKVIELA